MDESLRYPRQRNLRDAVRVSGAYDVGLGRVVANALRAVFVALLVQGSREAGSEAV